MTREKMMRIRQTIYLGFLTTLLISAIGCVGSRFTHLTPSTLSRNPDNRYTIEMEYKPSFGFRPVQAPKAEVIVNGKSFPMRPVDTVDQRWETTVQLDPSVDSASLQYKLTYNRGHDLHSAKVRSDLSTAYRLRLRDAFGR